MNKLVWRFCFIAAALGMVAFVLSLAAATMLAVRRWQEAGT